MIKFIVDERNRVVIAYFADSNGDASDELDWAFDINSRILRSMGKMRTALMNIPPISLPYGYRAVSELNGYFRAMAKCDPYDEFDAEIGKQIASKKLLRKWNKCLRRALKYMYMDIVADMNSIRKVIIAADQKIEGGYKNEKSEI